MKGLLSAVVIAGLVGFCLGVVAIAVLGSQSLGINSSDPEHTRIAQGFTAQDLTLEATLQLHHIQTGPIEFMPNAPLVTFPAHLKTTQSIWSFSSGSDVDLVMIIYGPGNDGKSYMVTFGRFSVSAMQIEGWNRTVSWAIGQGQSTFIIKP